MLVTGGHIGRAHPGSILIVDDHSPNLAALEAVLEPAGYAVTRAASGQQALAELLGSEFDLVVLDVQMPDLDGFATASLIRQTPGNRHTPILFLTARDREQDEHFEQAAGAPVEYLMKPLAPDLLRAAVARMMPRPSAPAATDWQQSDSARATVWMAEDSTVEATRASRLLSEEFDVRIFREGSALLEQVYLGAPPDLLLLDWHLPDVSGIDICKSVRSVWDSTTVPVLIMTADASSGINVVGAFAAGANDYLRKPYWGPELVTRVRSLVQLRRSTERARVAEAAARAAMREVEERAAFERSLIAIVSHDLRNPLAAILNGAELLVRQSDGTTRAQQATAAAIRRSSERAVRMIRDLLDFSEARVGDGIPIQPARVELDDIVQAVVDEVGAAYPGRPIQASYAARASGDWDADRIAQAVGNLVSNALHYGLPGRPVRVETRADGALALVEVHNEGPPIPDELKRRLFQPFERGSAAMKTKSQGVGLGLYIVHEIARGHGGTVDVRSSESEGTVFTFRLPLPAKAALGAVAE